MGTVEQDWVFFMGVSVCRRLQIERAKRLIVHATNIGYKVPTECLDETGTLAQFAERLVMLRLAVSEQDAARFAGRLVAYLRSASKRDAAHAAKARLKSLLDPVRTGTVSVTTGYNVNELTVKCDDGSEHKIVLTDTNAVQLRVSLQGIVRRALDDDDLT